MVGFQLTLSFLLLLFQLSSSQDFNVGTESPAQDQTILEVASNTNTTVVPIILSDSSNPESVGSTAVPEAETAPAVAAIDSVDSVVVAPTNNQTNQDKDTIVATDVVQNNNDTSKDDTNVEQTIDNFNDNEEGSALDHEKETIAVEESAVEINNTTNPSAVNKTETDSVSDDMEHSLNATDENLNNTNVIESDMTNDTNVIGSDMANNTEAISNVTEIPMVNDTEVGTGLVSDGDAWTSEEDGFSPQTQLYIVAGTLGGVVFLLIILVLALALSVSRIKDQLATRGRYSPDGGQRSGLKGGEIFAYENGAFSNNTGGDMQERRIDGHEDLEKMGYNVYNGNRENVYKVNEPVNDADQKEGENIPMDNIRYSSPAATDRDRPVMRYEEGVIPLNEVRGSQRRSAPSRYH